MFEAREKALLQHLFLLYQIKWEVDFDGTRQSLFPSPCPGAGGLMTVLLNALHSLVPYTNKRIQARGCYTCFFNFTNISFLPP